jgi:hypothetical protein
MRSSVRWLLTAVLALGVLSPILGQLPRRGILENVMENGVDAPLLLANNGVKREIKLTDEQSNRIHKIVKEVSDKYQPEFRKAGRDRPQQAKIVADSARETRERVRQALPDILQPDQLKRLNEIQIQVNGIASFKRPEVQEKLDLTDEQKKEIRKIGDGLKQEVGEVMRDAASAPLRKMPGAIQKVKEMKDDATRKAVDKLTPEQKKTWKEMTGEKFDFKLELPLRPGGRP